MNHIEDTLSFLLAQMMKAQRVYADSRLKVLGLHSGQDLILLRLAENDGESQRALADRLEVEAPTITKMVQRMERAGLVERRSDETDARVSRVYLTARGRSLEAGIRQVWADLEAHLVQGLTLAEQALLRRLVIQMHNNLRDG